MDARLLARYIDHTLLHPTATNEQIETLVTESLQYQFRTVCVESKWLPTVVPKLLGSSVMPITVISFPGGDAPTDSKVKQAREAVTMGAQEVDMVLNRNLVFSYKYDELFTDIRSVVGALPHTPIKVILETSELSDEQKTVCCAIAQAAGAAFVKTSTGFSKGGATVHDVALMRRVVGPNRGVKASGGIRTLCDAIKMIEAGADRLGCSASVSIIRGLSPAAPSIEGHY